MNISMYYMHGDNRYLPDRDIPQLIFEKYSTVVCCFELYGFYININVCGTFKSTHGLRISVLKRLIRMVSVKSRSLFYYSLL